METLEHTARRSPASEHRVVADDLRPVVLIGPMSGDPAESVSCVNRAFVEGLSHRYSFAALDATRSYGNTRQSKLNPINLFYFIQQLFRWIVQLILRRPRIAHYAISSGWAMEKGLVYMKLARFLGAKTLGHLHSGEFIEHWESLSKSRKRFAAREFSRLDGLVLASEWWRDEIRNHVPLPTGRLFVVNNPIDAKFEPIALRMPVRRPEPAVLSLGVMGRAKGIFDILAAATILRLDEPFRLTLAGAEREPGIANEVADHVRSHGLSESVTQFGSIGGKQKVELFRESGIFLLPSYYENFPLVLVEAAAAGQAIITTPVGAIPEFFHEGVSALFVEPGNVEQIARTLLRLIQNPDERVRLGRAAREMFLTRLSRSRIMDSLDSVYRALSLERVEAGDTTMTTL